MILILLESLFLINRKIMNKIYLTDASITKDLLGRDKGIITRMAGAIDYSAIEMYLTIESFRKFPNHLIPKAKLEFEVTPSLNIVKVTTNKDISPLKKGDFLTFIFDDGCYIRYKFGTGRISKTGGEVLNFAYLTNLQLWEFTQKKLVQIILSSALETNYDFINKPNGQYQNQSEGQLLIQIVCNNLIGIKKILLNIIDVKEDNPNETNNPFAFLE